jgi:hypothetical protein
VKFVEADDPLWAVKDMPARIAAKEYDVLRRLEEMGLPAVRPAGLVLQPEFDTAILVTRYLEGSWQYRRLFMRPAARTSRSIATRLLDAMAGLMVELHRHGVFWGDCSLANTLFSRGRPDPAGPGWSTRRHLRFHPTLSRGSASTTSTSWWRTSRWALSTSPNGSVGPDEMQPTLIDEAEPVLFRYETSGGSCTPSPVFRVQRSDRVEGTIRRLNEPRLRRRRTVSATRQRRAEPAQTPCRRW